MDKDHEAYLDYYDTHREEFRDEPYRAVCGTMTIRMLEEGRLTPEDNERQIARRRKSWEDFHLAKAESLGYQVDLNRLDWDLGGLACTIRAQQRST